MEFNLWTMVTVAVVVGCTIPILGIYASIQEKKLKYGGANDTIKAELEQARADLARANARIDAMGERLKVLERIATDPDVQLAHSLNELEQEAASTTG